MNRLSRLLIALGLILTGCIKSQQTVVVPAVIAPVEATITGVEVLQLFGDAPDVRVVISGTVPDICSRIKEPEIERVGRLFTITLPITQATLGQCPLEPIAFERVVRLKIEPTAGPVDGRFGLLVSGELQNFDIPTARAAVGQLAVTGPDSQQKPVVKRSDEENTPAPVATAEAAPTVEKVILGPATGPARCINKAAFFEDVTIPSGTSLEPGTGFVKTWKVRNEGTCSWGPGYHLLLVDGDDLGAPSEIPLTPAVPHEVVQVSVKMTTPIIPGSYHNEWGFATPDGQSFGVGSAGLYPLSMKVGVRQMPLVGLGCEAELDRDAELRVLELINAERALLGLPAHGIDEALSQVARAHSIERGCIGVHSHYGADGKNYDSRVKKAGITFQWINEIIYNGNYGAKSAVHWWVYESALHHDIVMSNKYTTVGVGYAKTKRGPNKEYFTVLFTKP